jgi:hypothetical protein
MDHLKRLLIWISVLPLLSTLTLISPWYFEEYNQSKKRGYFSWSGPFKFGGWEIDPLWLVYLTFSSGFLLSMIGLYLQRQTRKRGQNTKYLEWATIIATMPLLAFIFGLLVLGLIFIPAEK